MPFRYFAAAVCTLLLVAGPLDAQARGDFVPLAQAGRSVAALRRPVSVDLPSTTVEEALRALARAADLGLTFDRSLPDLKARTSVDTRAVPVGDAIEQLLQGTRLDLWVSPSGEMVLRDKTASRPATPTTGASLFGRLSEESGAPVAGAQVYLEPGDGAAPRGTLSGAQGDFRLVGLSPGRYRLRVTHLGYQAASHEVTLAAGEARRLDLTLQVAAVELDGLVVDANRDARRERARFETDAGVTARVVGGRELKAVPGLAEADVMRAMELLPGVVSTSDFSSAFNVRGGSADQNLVLLDGFPIFNPFHFGGLFSVFNADVVERAELQSGGFGAEYGGRISSVLNVESRAGEDDRLHVEGGVSMLATRVTARSRLPSGAGGLLGGSGGDWYISARRSYFDRFVPSDSEIPAYTLTDFQGRFTIGTAGGGRLSVTGYGGRDILDRTAVTTARVEDEPGDALRFRWSWGNGMVGLRWAQPVGGWLLDARLGHSRYSEELVFSDYSDMHFTSSITQDLAHLGFSRDVARGLTLRVGAEASHFEARNLQEMGHTEFWRRDGDGTSGAAFTALRWRAGERWLVDAGVRLDAWAADDSTRLVPAPRFAVKRFLGAERAAALKVSVGRYTQFLHSVRNEEIPISNDSWVVVDRHSPTAISDQAQIGYERFWGEAWQFSAETYLRRFRGLILPNTVDDLNDPSDDFLVGRGRSYGLDLLVRREIGRLRGWTTLSLLKAERTFPDPTAVVWDGPLPEITFAPVFDRRVDLDIVLEYALPWGIEAGTRWNFGSGVPYTLPTSQHVAWEYDAVSGRYRAPDEWSYRTVMDRRNAERYPAYHRLDFTLRRTYQRRWGVATPYLQVLNVYNRKNVMVYEYNYHKAPPTRGGLSQFPILPALGVEVAF